MRKTQASRLRGFPEVRAAPGESAMAYVRGWRLEGAMRHILAEPGVRLWIWA